MGKTKMRKEKIKVKSFAEGEYYHIYNRGVEKRNIFLSTSDYERALFCILAFSVGDFHDRMNRINQHGQHLMLAMLTDPIYIRKFMNKDPLVRVICFCLMRNHFHLLLEERSKDGISRYMQRLGNSYTKYFNAKYKRSGHLFGSSYQCVHIDDNEYLKYLSRYIHRNPIESTHKKISGNKKKYIKNYPWSSYQDYIFKNRWGGLLSPAIITDQFSSMEEYKEFVEEAFGDNDAIDKKYFLDGWPTSNVGQRSLASKLLSG